jgi:hypothetical protein
MAIDAAAAAAAPVLKNWRREIVREWDMERSFRAGIWGTLYYNFLEEYGTASV